ncbi:MucR family transcriptional regulator [Couchioplanes caeruleus]|uniref:MucR family transcriptional regulator n=1 Tax=Couchioplanes caeruleus TaxID=56438 RepID=UPI0020C10D0B|nr:MucR family transcriptional regulator [Couchioplanes caeruleus]UQU67408.1 MucR family transcriptional regulator [Couchioplanes caeruleus]
MSSSDPATARSRRPRPVTDLATIAAGVQPQHDGWLLCRLCGRWFRSVGRHLQPGHGISPAEYKAMFELPVTRGLIGDDLRAQFRDRQRELLRTNPAVRAAFALDDSACPERQLRQKRGVQRKAETATRAGVVRSQQNRIAELSTTNTRRAQARLHDYDERARRRGYRDLHHLLRETAGLSYADCAALMGWTPSQVHPWRKRYGIASTAKQARQQQQHAAREHGLTDLTAGTQPVNDQGLLRCLTCGRWRSDLTVHVRQAHQLTAAQYRGHFRLPSDTALVSRALQEARTATARTVARDGAAAGGRAKSAAARERWDAAAHRAGYSDIASLLQAMPDNIEAATRLKIKPDEIRRIRHRYRDTSEEPTSRVTRGAEAHPPAD